jgi:hypothetical protein
MAGGPPRAAGAGGPRAGYYSLDAVLAEEAAVPCSFGVACSGVGRALDPSAGLEDVRAGAAVELPLWLLPPLAQRGMLGVRRALRPDPLPTQGEGLAHACGHLRPVTSLHPNPRTPSSWRSVLVICPLGRWHGPLQDGAPGG